MHRHLYGVLARYRDEGLYTALVTATRGEEERNCRSGDGRQQWAQARGRPQSRSCSGPVGDWLR